MLKSRYVMIGGFLGAGKTTALSQIAQRLHARGFRVGLITNDQSTGLVDTTILSGRGFPTEEISGGCFCCKFNSLMQAAERLTADVQPDIFLAEPVGSCTDLMATVTYPLRRMYGDNYHIAPLSVMLDPIRARRILGMDDGKAFSPKVRYIYDKQLEEAEIIVINKCDLLDDAALDELESALRRKYTQSEVFRVSARHGDGLEQWIERLTAEVSTSGAAMEIDYDTYAEGEALLGWVNLSAQVEGRAFDGNSFLSALIEGIARRLRQDGAEVAHLKTTLTPSEGNDMAVANLVREDVAPELVHRLVEPLDGGQLIVNLRAEGAPEALEGIVQEVLQAELALLDATARVEHSEAFRPGRPTPTHRLTAP